LYLPRNANAFRVIFVSFFASVTVIKFYVNIHILTSCKLSIDNPVDCGRAPVEEEEQ